METKFNFNSQVATSCEQSERLLKLGLKKETADMIYVEVICTDGSREWEAEPIMKGLTALDYDDSWLPAWGLHRLMILAEMKGTAFLNLDAAYETTISIIAAKIRFGYFNKEYLV